MGFVGGGASWIEEGRSLSQHLPELTMRCACFLGKAVRIGAILGSSGFALGELRPGPVWVGEVTQIDFDAALEGATSGGLDVSPAGS